MSLAAIVATVMLAIMLVFVGMVIWATMRQIDDESRRAAVDRDR